MKIYVTKTPCFEFKLALENFEVFQIFSLMQKWWCKKIKSHRNPLQPEISVALYFKIGPHLNLGDDC